MSQKKVHIALSLLLVYCLSLTVQAMPSVIFGDVQVRKECPNKKNVDFAKSNILDQITEQFEKNTDDGDKQDEKPIEVSVCPSSTAFIVGEYQIEFAPKAVERSTVVFSPSYYISPDLDNIPEPPKSV